MTECETAQATVLSVCIWCENPRNWGSPSTQKGLMGLQGTVDLKQGSFYWNLSLCWGWGGSCYITTTKLLFTALWNFCSSCFSPCFINQSEELGCKSQSVPPVPLVWVWRRDSLFSKGLTEFLALSCSLLQPPFILLWEKPPVGRWTRKGFSVSNVFDSEMWALLLFLSVLFNKFVLPCKGDIDKGTLCPLLIISCQWL